MELTGCKSVQFCGAVFIQFCGTLQVHRVRGLTGPARNHAMHPSRPDRSSAAPEPTPHPWKSFRCALLLKMRAPQYEEYTHGF